MERTKGTKNSCHVCQSDPTIRKQIESELLTGKSYASIGRGAGIDPYWVSYHAKNCLWSHNRGRSAEVVAKIQSLDMVGQLQELLTETRAILTDAKKKKSHHLALQAIKELRGTTNLILSAQAFAWQTQNSRKESPEQIIADFHSQSDLKLQAALNVLSPVEREVYEQLSLKLISGNSHIDIAYLDYSTEKRPYEVSDPEAVQDTVGSKQPQASAAFTPPKTDKDNDHT